MGCQTSTEIKKHLTETPANPPGDNSKFQDQEHSADLKENQAATKIQALYRGFRTRDNLKKLTKDQIEKEAKEAKEEIDKKADELLKVVLEDKALASQEAKLNLKNNPEEEVLRSLKKIIANVSQERDDLPIEALDTQSQLNDQVNTLAEQVNNAIIERVNSEKDKASDHFDSLINKTSSLSDQLVQKIVPQSLEKIPSLEQEINQMNQFVKNIQEIDISKAVTEAVETVKEQVSELLPESVIEYLPEMDNLLSNKKDELTNDLSKTDLPSAVQDENNNIELKKEEEEIDIDLGDPEVAKVATKLQATFKSRKFNPKKK